MKSAILVICGIGIVTYSAISPVTATGPKAPAVQDVARVENRISSVEQRLYSIESNISRLEQMTTLQRSIPSPAQRDPEISLLRNEIAMLKGRLRELECGLIRLDERTLSSSARDARPRGGTQQDPCRLDPDRALEFSSRP